MKELTQYRTSLIERLVKVTDEFRAACLGVPDMFALAAEGAWTIHQVAVHVRDVHKLVYSVRVRTTAAEEDPEFQNFDPEAYMNEHYSVDEPLLEILDELQGSVLDLASMLRELTPEDWSRTSRHALLGHGFTLQTWVERDLAHIERHLDVVRNQK